MTTENINSHDPAKVNTTEVQPKPGLGSNFERAAYAQLGFSTKARIWGDSSPASTEPVSAEFTVQLRQKILRQDGFRCMFCGFYSQRNEIHNVSDNHRDVREHNLRTADPLCHGWQHLGELGDGQAFIAYLPGLNPQDVNHLQRTLMVALDSPDAALKADAKKLLNWLASHRQYTQDAWGTYEPAVFANAMVRFEDNSVEKKSVVFEDLALVFNPGPYSDFAKGWASESYASLPAPKWGQVYHDVMNAPI